MQLRTLLEEYEDFNCVVENNTANDWLNSILKYSPDIVFVNLNKKASSLFQILMELYQYMNTIPLFIGISKNKQYAYDAIKNGFFD